MNQYFMLFIYYLFNECVYNIYKKDLILIARKEFYNIKFELILAFRK